MTCKLSIIVPSIRPQNWRRFLESVQKSCTGYVCEVIFVGPFSYEGTLQDFPIARWIKRYDSVPVCLQIGCIEAKGELLFHTVDDGILLENSLDNTLDYYYKMCEDQDIVNCRYRESPNFGGQEFPLQYWVAGSYPTHYGQKYVNPHWNLSLQPLISKNLFIGLGGLDCSFEYSNHPHVDLSFRIQQNGGIVYHSPLDVSTADHGQNDHGPIQSAQEGIDAKRFNEMWNADSAAERIYLNIMNHEPYQGMWKHRFKQEYKSYEEMCAGEGYVKT